MRGKVITCTLFALRLHVPREKRQGGEDGVVLSTGRVPRLFFCEYFDPWRATGLKSPTAIGCHREDMIGY